LTFLVTIKYNSIKLIIWDYLMFSVQPSIDPAVFAIASGFRALSISVKSAPLINPDAGKETLIHACQSLLTHEAAWAQAHLLEWADVFRRFGAKPQRTPCSAEALHKRVLRDGSMPSIDPVVDLYNAVSIQYAIPVGGENISAYQGAPQLVIATGTELFDTIKNGEPANESPGAGEVIWRDDIGATCRRWNWRQGIRTRLDANASHMWFILESLPAMPLAALHEAGKALVTGLQRIMPEASTETQFIEG
jgi:DNA/RNA-binding domain of Phe-tRNA-synthetase-like protein